MYASKKDKYISKIIELLLINVMYYYFWMIDNYYCYFIWFSCVESTSNKILGNFLIVFTVLRYVMYLFLYLLAFFNIDWIIMNSISVAFYITYLFVWNLLGRDFDIFEFLVFFVFMVKIGGEIYLKLHILLWLF